jgi:ubiquinone/menaquinone biosynthesis C-methylase UbiE
MTKDKKDLFRDQEYLVSQQYQNDSNLNARMQLHLRFSTNKQDFREWTFSHIRTLPENSRILELGCGPGNLWVENLNNIPDTWDITLSDLSPGMVETARKNLGSASEQFQFRVIDAQQIPFDSEWFEGVVANHMLYHVPDIGKALAEIQRVLKPGGKLFAVTNGQKHMSELRELIKSIDPQGIMRNSGEIFGLENGRGQLSEFFPDVKLVNYESSIVVTETAPLVAYILSMKRSTLIEENPQLAKDAIDKIIGAHGAFNITSQAGMFVATKAA